MNENSHEEMATSWLLAMVNSRRGVELIRSAIGKGMESPNQDGLFCLTAPDGVLVNVVSGRISSEELQFLIRSDITRQLEPIFEKMIEDGKSDEEMIQATFPLYLELKDGYSLTRLSTPK
jgi:hypothetical protein